MYCAKCGNQLDDAAVICPKCGVPTANFKPAAPQSAPQAQQTIHVDVNTGTPQPTETYDSLSDPIAWRKGAGAVLLFIGVILFIASIYEGIILLLIIGCLLIAGGACLFAWSVYSDR